MLNVVYKGNFSRYDQYTKHNLIFIIFDEISLEGLDGITIEALWKRIEHTLMVENMLDGLKEVIWQIVCLNEQISFFELPDARPELVIYNASQRGPDIYKVSRYMHTHIIFSNNYMIFIYFRLHILPEILLSGALALLLILELT